MNSYFYVGLGSAAGGMLRYWLSGLIAERFGTAFPWGTIIVNISGSFLIGFIAQLTDSSGRILVPPSAREFAMVGILGGYTTFSSFSLQTLNLAQEGQWFFAGANVVLSMGFCLSAVWLGFILARLLF